jgi:hypothetical protein
MLRRLSVLASFVTVGIINAQVADKLEPLPPGPIDTLLFPDSRGSRNFPARPDADALSPHAVMTVDSGYAVLPNRSYEKRDPTGKYEFDYAMAKDKDGNKAVFYSVSTQISGKIATIRKMLPLDEIADQPERYAAETVADQLPGAKILSIFGDIGGWVVQFFGSICGATEDFVKALQKFEPYAPSWLQPTLSAIIAKAPSSWIGTQTTKMLMPGGANLSTQRLIAELVMLYGADVTARDEALNQIASTHLIITGQAANSPNPPYTAEMALMLEHTVGMDLTKDPRWAPALAAAISAQSR